MFSLASDKDFFKHSEEVTKKDQSARHRLNPAAKAGLKMIAKKLSQYTIYNRINASPEVSSF